MDSSKLVRAAVGRFARLGDLYDARKDELVNVNIFKSTLTEDEIYEEEANSVDIDFIITDSMKEKFEKLDINADLSLSILSGLVKLKGSASYLQDEKNSSRCARMTLTYTVRTRHQEVDGIRGKVDKQMLEAVDATHVVVGIDWGAKCNVTCQYEFAENEDVTKIEGELRAEIENLKNIVSLEGGAKVDLSNRGKSEEKKFSYHSRCDVSDMSKEIPSTFEGAISMATGLPLVVQKTNEGKGLPLQFTLMPLNMLRKMCKIETQTNLLYKQIQEDTVKMCFQTMEKIRAASQKLSDLVKDLNDSRNFVLEETMDTAQDLQNNFEVAESKFKTAIQDVLIAVRSGSANPSAIEKAQTDFLQDPYSPAEVNKKIGSFDPVLRKIRLINDLKSRGVLCLGRGSTVELALHQNADRKVYLLYLDFEGKHTKSDNWRRQTDLFFHLLLAHGHDQNYKFLVTDWETVPGCCIKTSMSIEYYEKGFLYYEDVLAEEGEDLDYCCIKLDGLDPLRRKPLKRVEVEIKCPKSIKGRCPRDVFQWVCRRCKDVVEYGIDDQYFYCKCGGTKYTNSSFRCNSPRHGLSYVPFESKVLLKMLKQLRMVQETNILILGETGVGKSTWINAIANYLAFGTLESARDSNAMKVLIPTQFSYTSETGDTREIKVGSKNANEVIQSGQSATQCPKAYKFAVGKHVISLIDTPGIGDVRGLEQDEKNFESILAHLSYYNEIHGICILLKPNDSRLTVTFRFCITELLTHLHKSAAENIIFCFTNARGTFYRPGDTLPTLKALISDYKGATVSVTPHNLFCFDNESFRFLACLMNGVSFRDDDIETYASSWNRAVNETTRLFMHILSLEPHSVQETMSLNNARRLILEISKPLAETAANIQRNIDAAERKKRELNASKKTASELQDRLYLDAIDLEAVKLGFPRTVCTEGSCVEHVQVVGNTSKVVYRQQCHPHCYLSGVATETINNTKLQDCAAMDSSNNCRHCGHSWRVHMHMTYDLERVAKRVLDKNIQGLLNKEESSASKLKTFLEDVEVYCQELREEQQEITDICAQFGCYLKKNAITPFNDEVDGHLELLINEEDKKPDRSQKTIDDLTRMRQKYRQKKEIITKAMDRQEEGNVEYISDPSKVEALKEKLFHLKHNGKSLEKIFRKVQAARSEYHFNESQMPHLGYTGSQEKGLFKSLQRAFKSTTSYIKKSLSK